MADKMTSSEISKRLRSLDEEKNLILQMERETRTFVSAEGYEDVVPEYDFRETQRRITEIDEEVRRLKHALNIMNSTTKLAHFDMTLDEALVYMAQLNRRKDRLDEMRRVQPKSRLRDQYGESSLVEYLVRNYDAKEVEEVYRAITDTVDRIQMDIDRINQTVEIEV